MLIIVVLNNFTEKPQEKILINDLKKNYGKTFLFGIDSNV